ncbi:MAG TPA: hypothetical protein VI854_05935 [Acidimicrobiia bacterium]|nr:hypothetical protein [Acidimicrobiia bacterium]
MPRVPARRLPQDGGLGNALAVEVRGADAGLREPVTLGPPAGDDDDGRDAGVVEVDDVIEAGPQHRRGTAVVLRRPEHDQRLRGPGAVVAPGPPDLHERDPEVPDEEHGDGEHDPPENPRPPHPPIEPRADGSGG